VAQEPSRMNYWTKDEIKKSLIKLFIIPSIVAMVLGFLYLGYDNFSFKIVMASIASGFDFMFTISIFDVLFGPVRGAALGLLYAAAGFLAGMTWSEIAYPPWPAFITGGVACILSLAYIYANGNNKRKI
jgi:hypothetical protein